MRDPNAPIMLSSDQLREIVREEFDNALTKMGFDTTEPLESQKDLQFVREWRVSAEGVRKKALTTMAAIFVTGIIGALWLGIKSTFANIPHSP